MRAHYRIPAQDPITGELDWIYPQHSRIRKFILSTVFVLFSVVIVVASVVAVIIIKMEMNSEFNCEREDSDLVKCTLATSLLPTVLNALSILLLGMIYEKLARWFTYWGEE